MSFQFPYCYISCPCSLNSSTEIPSGEVFPVKDEDDEEKPFDPRSPRSNYSLYPLDYLMWCEDCHELRCPRCTIEEVVCWYCPSCLFEVAASMVKNEGNRCTRNCFNCPICTAPLGVSSMDTEAGGLAGPWILGCDYCCWTSLDIGVKFDRPNNIFGQLNFSNAAKASRAQAARSAAPRDDGQEAPIPKDHDAKFRALKSFYMAQIAKAAPANPIMSPGGDPSINSPSSLARIMSIYTGTGTYGKKSTKRSPVRGSRTPREGLFGYSPEKDARAAAKLAAEGWEGTASREQRAMQFDAPRFVSDLKPVPTLLRTKRSRRCRECRHILVRPEAKVTSTRYRIKLVATNYVPTMSLATLQSPASGAPEIDLLALPPSKPLQFFLTVRNPLFDSIKVTLATPPTIPAAGDGDLPVSRVTILCPQFEVGSNQDIWDEALGSSADPRRSSKAGPSLVLKPGDAEGRVAEAGKIWERGRNWTTVVLELVCGRFLEDREAKSKDEDTLEIPISVRLEYEAEPSGEPGAAPAESADRKEKRELTYWCVLGVGKVAKVVA